MKYLYVLSICVFIFGCNSNNEVANTDGNTSNSSLVSENQDANKFADDTLRMIYDFQDTRNTTSLLPYLNHNQPTYQQAAITAFASIQDSLALDSLIQQLTDEQATTRALTAYSIGQIRNVSANDALINAINQESDAEVKIKLLEALGKCADQNALKFLATYYGDKEIGYGVALGIFRALLKGVYNDAGLNRILELITPLNHDKTRVIASTYLARSRKQDLAPFSNAISLTLRNDNNPHVRMNCARALGNATLSEVADDLIHSARQDESYLVRINALRAMRNLGNHKPFKELAYELLNDNNTQVGVVASEFILASSDKKDFKRIKKLIDSPMPWMIQTNLLAAAAKAKDKASKFTIEEIHKSENPYEEGALLLALAEDIEKYNIIKERLFHATNPVIKNYAIMALSNIRLHPDYKELKKHNESIDQEFVDIIKHCIKSRDIALVYHASLLMRNPSIDFKAQLGNLDFIEQSLSAMKLPKEIEAYQELSKTLNYLKGQNSNQKNPASSEELHTIDWKHVTSIPKNQTLRIITSKGDIVIQTFVEAVPGTVSEIIKLVQAGFYDGKTFHRVVPNFVAQGGCPRGDGFGGLDYTIRSEFPPLYYQEGFVGMASAGKDTESCQWFITHSPTPHLDGKYTIFAKVISGMPVVHQLLVGDKIERVEVIKANES